MALIVPTYEPVRVYRNTTVSGHTVTLLTQEKLPRDKVRTIDVITVKQERGSGFSLSVDDDMPKLCRRQCHLGMARFFVRYVSLPEVVAGQVHEIPGIHGVE